MLNQLIAELLRHYGRRAPTIGDFGVEVEVEGRHLPQPSANSVWTAHEDHSLRGESLEYVLKNPLPKNDVKKALAVLAESLKNSTIHNSNRTSVHVHANVSTWLVQEVYTLIALYYIFEDLLVKFSGEERQGNMYCLRCSDAEFLVLQIVRSLTEENYFPGFVGDNIRYSSLNLKPILTFGSVEFRSFRGTVDPTEISSWIDIIDTLVTASKNFNSPLDVIQGFQQHQVHFVERIFGANPAFVGWLFNQPSLMDNMRQGFAYAFEIAYAPRRKHPWIDVAKEKAKLPKEQPVQTVIKKVFDPFDLQPGVINWAPVEMPMAVAGPAPRRPRRVNNAADFLEAVRDRQVIQEPRVNMVYNDDVVNDPFNEGNN